MKYLQILNHSLSWETEDIERRRREREERDERERKEP